MYLKHIIPYGTPNSLRKQKIINKSICDIPG